MNVKDLKETLNDIPDNWDVMVKVGDTKMELSALDLKAEENQFWFLF